MELKTDIMKVEDLFAEQSEFFDEDIRIYYKKKPYDVFKRLMDFLLSLFAIIVLSPVLIIVALIIFIDDPKGNPIYVSKRIGKDGKEFTFFKFRTMQVGADRLVDGLMEKNEADGPAFKIKNDPRITRVGNFLRKSCLDELMQLFNILNGTMSIVGPRPPIQREVEQYTERQKLRLAVRPGLTCIWQTQPDKNDLSFDEWIDMDLEYIKNRSLWLDIKLIFGTFKCVFRGTGR